jgi:hypothetical protein
MKMRVHVSISGTGGASGRTSESEIIKAQHAVTGFNDPCTDEGANNCRTEEVTHNHDNFSTQSDYIDKTVLESRGLGIVHRARYYNSGSVTFTFNNWSGTMTYGTDAFSAPRYTASDGTDTVSGTYNYTAAP